jgi:hypothetical protein
MKSAIYNYDPTHHEKSTALPVVHDGRLHEAAMISAQTRHGGHVQD